MAKSMARIKNGVVTNIEWCANIAEESDSLKETYGIPVSIGDVYDGNFFYHNGLRLMTALEIAQMEINDLREQNKILSEQLLELSKAVQAQYIPE